jgi:hypothetical protein
MSGERSGRLPNVLLIGAMKAGTTSLAAWLDALPDVHVAPQKEVRFFNEPYHYWLGEPWYREQFMGAGAAVAIVDATPMMENPIAVDHAAELLPDARLVAVLRDPVERAYSHYWHIRSIGQERRSFARAIADERADPTAARGAVPRDYLWRSTYIEHLRHVEARFPRASMLVVLFDDLRDDPAALYRGVCRFIGIRDDVPDEVGMVRNPRPERPARLRDSIARRLGLGLRGSQGYPSLDPRVRASLVAEFDGSIAALERWLDRDLSAWRSRRVPV